MPWGWQYLGRHRRVVLPSCAVAKIRQVFPSESEDYTSYNIHQLHHNIFTYIIVLRACSYIRISNYVYNVRIKGLSGCLYALANGDGVSGNVDLSSSFKHISSAFSINSFVYSVKTLKYM